MKSGDKVTITSPLVHRVYGVKPTDEFEIKAVTSDGVTILTNDWVLKSNHVKPVVSLPVFNLNEAVDEQIAEFIEEDYAFTAFDVTNVLRDKNPNESVFHYRVKDIVHSAMEKVTNYKRELINVGQAVEPWLYLPEGYDASSYVPGNNAQVLSLEKDDDTTEFGFSTDSSFAQPVTVGNYNDDNVVVTAPKSNSSGVVRKFLSKFGF